MIKILDNRCKDGIKLTTTVTSAHYAPGYYGKMFMCPLCDWYIFKNDNYCGGCGVRLKWKIKEVE